MYTWLCLEEHRCSFLFVMYAAAVTGEAASIAIPVFVTEYVVSVDLALELDTVQKVAG